MEKLIKLSMVMITLLLVTTSVWAKDDLLLIRAAGANFEEAENSIVFELEYDFNITEVVITNNEKFTSDDISSIMDSISPKIVILMNNHSVSLYRDYQKASQNKVPTVSLMGLNLGNEIKTMDNAYAIEYEIPVVTAGVKLRSFMKQQNLSKIGIVHSATLTPFIEANKEYCTAENIDLVTIEISDERVNRNLSKSLNKLVSEDKVGAIWVPIDNLIINSSTIKEVWIPFQKKNKIPIIVGAANLANPKYHFGTFAVIPDHSGLGSQAASAVYDIKDNNWSVSKSGATEPPLSVKSVVNLPDNINYFGIDEKDCDGIDIILK